MTTGQWKKTTGQPELAGRTELVAGSVSASIGLVEEGRSAGGQCPAVAPLFAVRSWGQAGVGAPLR